MVFQTILKYLPMSDNMKVAFGTGCVLFVSYMTVSKKGAQCRRCRVVRTTHACVRAGVSYDTMAEKREAMRKKAEAEEAAAAAATAK